MGVGYAEPMPRRARIALAGAAVGTALLVIVWYLAHYVGVVQRADVSILRGFVELDRPRLDELTNFIANLCDPKPYVLLAALPVVVALLRGRPRVAVTIGLIMLGANETTQLLKPVLAGPRLPVPGVYLSAATWPSGHATAAMSLALCAVIAAPARRRPVVAAIMAVFAIAVCYSFLELGWHYPSDVLGGFLVATTWTLLGVAGLSLYEARRSSRPARFRPEPAAAFSLGQAFAPVAAILSAALAFAGVIVLARPHEVIDYARAHETFMVGAFGIGALGLTLAYAIMLMLRRG
jgi:membrane-associated phospholipid phosphatase